METTVKERIVTFLLKMKISQKKFETACGLSNGYVNGLKKSPSADVLQKIFGAYPMLNQDWLIKGEGDMIVAKPEDDAEDKPRFTDNYKEGKPFYDVPFAMGYDLPFNDNTSNPTCMIDFRPYNKCDFWCKATGDSMYPTICDGDIVAVKQVQDFSRSVISRDIYAIVLYNDLRAIKRLIDRGDSFILRSDNDGYEDQVVPKTDVRCVYRVMATLKMKMF